MWMREDYIARYGTNTLPPVYRRHFLQIFLSALSEDHRKKLVHIVEVGITSRERIKTVETEKKHKYADLAVQLGRQHAGYATLVTPYVMTWDGSTTAFSKKYREQIGLSDHVHAHIQANVIGDTRKIVTRTMGLDKEGELRRKQIVYNTEPDRLNSVNQTRSNYP
ncbi:MAG: uncharacterized protein A8A55_0446 [Amphiamblys sp. WSBS2006]|nr:MAG: uncharacterized protein A8A55_0446 [Amphiamblys sp. WSBS2006]